jgi:uncharacterized protein (TIGR02145 family)
MNKLLWSSSIALATAAFFTACDETTTITESTGPSSIAKFKDLEKCATGNEGDMVYVKDSSAMFLCTDKEWKKLSVESLKGADGKDGVDGKDGKDGENGKNCTVKENKKKNGYDITCGNETVTITNGNDGDPGKSAFEIAQEHGFKGSEEEWLESLKDDGCTLKANVEGSGYDLVCENNSITLYKLAWCGIKPYNPDISFCDERNGGTVYKMVTIAPEGTDYSETWMGENLNYKTSEGSVCYGAMEDNEKLENCDRYGRLYDWSAVMGNGEKDDNGHFQGICPTGWHVPASAEWEALYDAVGGMEIAGEKLKANSDLWIGEIDPNDIHGNPSPEIIDDNGRGDDTYGFTALPIGYHHNADWLFGKDAFFWTSTERKNKAYRAWFDYTSTGANVYPYEKDNMYSLRCIKTK